MPENEFERQVKQEMDRFTLRPSEAVWQEVENEIRRKKRRRVIFFISLLAGLGLAGWITYPLFTGRADSTWVQETNTAGNNKTVTPHTIIYPDSSGNNKNSIINKNDDTATVQPAGKDVPVTNEPGSVTSKTNTEKENNSIPAQRENPAGNNKAKMPVKKPVKKKNIIVAKPAGQQEKEKKDRNTAIQSGEEEKKEDVKKIDSGDIAQQEIKKDTILKVQDAVAKTDTATKIDSAIAAVINDSAQTAPIAKKKSSKIKPGFELSGGVASNSENVFSFAKAASQNQNFFNGLPGNGGGSTAGGGNYIQPPSAIESGKAFRIAFVAETRLSKRSSFYTGLRYSYMSEKIKVAANTFSNSATLQYASYAYPSRPERSHTNKYHFIEMPLMYQLQLNKGTRTALLWNGGISLGYLAGSNALVYDTVAGGIYYKDKSAFNKMHFNFGTGFSFRFGMNKKMQWSLGPELSLDMTKLLKQNAFMQRRFLLFTGVTGRVFFINKNKQVQRSGK